MKRIRGYHRICDSFFLMVCAVFLGFYPRHMVQVVGQAGRMPHQASTSSPESGYLIVLTFLSERLYRVNGLGSALVLFSDPWLFSSFIR